MRTRNRLLALLLAVAAAAAGPAAAQEQGRATESRGVVALQRMAQASPAAELLARRADLSLTGEQVRALTQLHRDLQARNAAVVRQYEQAEDAQSRDRSARSGPADSPPRAARGRAIVEARRQLVRNQAQAREQALALLSSEQRGRLRSAPAPTPPGPDRG